MYYNFIIYLNLVDVMDLRPHPPLSKTVPIYKSTPRYVKDTFTKKDPTFFPPITTSPVQKDEIDFESEMCTFNPDTLNRLRQKVLLFLYFTFLEISSTRKE